MTTLAGFPRLFGLAVRPCVRGIAPARPCEPSRPAFPLWRSSVAGYRTRYRLPWFQEPPTYRERVVERDPEREKLASDVVGRINELVATDATGRLFAVVYLGGMRHKVTDGDVVTVSGHWPPRTGDRLALEKVLLVGGRDFTLVGRPILNRELVSVDATVVQKTLSHTITRFRFRQRKQFRRLNFYRIHRTMIRIDSVRINGDVDEKREVEGLDRVY
ncbi:39S ribosomal protein L21, mitochondrial [Ceratina calcarata]|uniref:Large ribosomal subunit protein bL21m n=1 Tax=Ceratina calcarata TaxID=156304 RepID=A0AAJ7JCW6_9HYME|nr:39S ribosomal protein L21, mitochondrial [Ceratina calcarata]